MTRSDDKQFGAGSVNECHAKPINKGIFDLLGKSYTESYLCESVAHSYN